MKIYTFDQRTDDWMNVRLGKLTGSDFHTMLGNSETKKRKILLKAIERIFGKSDEVQYTNADMQRGVELEEYAILLYEMQSQNIVDKVGFVELNDYVGCSPDGLIGNDGMIEVKCPCMAVYMKQVLDDKIKPEYYTQIQFNLWVTGRKWCDYVMYNENVPLYIKRIPADAEYQQKIANAVTECISAIDEIVKQYKERKQNV